MWLVKKNFCIYISNKNSLKINNQLSTLVVSKRNAYQKERLGLGSICMMKYSSKENILLILTMWWKYLQTISSFAGKRVN